MSLLLFFIVLIILVLVHEFGHFIVAKRAGIRVDEFAFGFPPRLFSIKKGETTYSFNALPLGGYVKIYGENPEEVKGENTKRSFAHAPRAVQSLVVLAGIFFNLLLAWLLISTTLMIGILAPVDESAYPLQSPKLMVIGTHEHSPAALAGLVEGDILLTIADGEEHVNATSPEAVSGFIAPREGKPLSLQYEHLHALKQTTIIPVSGISTKGGAIGIYMDMVGTLKLPFHKALWEGAIKTGQYTKLTAVGIYDFLKTALTGHADLSQVTGPVGIVHAVGVAAQIGFVNLLLFTALISINLAVINVLPFPALDGGRLFFIIIESVIRKPVIPVVLNVFNMIGFALLMFFMLVVTYHDIATMFIK